MKVFNWEAIVTQIGTKIESQSSFNKDSGGPEHSWGLKLSDPKLTFITLMCEMSASYGVPHQDVSRRVIVVIVKESKRGLTNFFQSFS